MRCTQFFLNCAASCPNSFLTGKFELYVNGIIVKWFASDERTLVPRAAGSREDVLCRGVYFLDLSDSALWCFSFSFSFFPSMHNLLCSQDYGYEHSDTNP